MNPSSSLLLFLTALASLPALAADRPIALNPVNDVAWEFVTPGTAPARPRRGMAAGFWQRASGAKTGVGANFVGSVEFQLPEAAPARVRSATYQFSGRQSQCSGAEPVVFDVYAYAADGKADVGDASAGTKVAQLTADCRDNPAFTRPIDVTHIVRQLSVPAGVRHVGFNVRKANNRQGPSLFNFNPGHLTVVLADQEIAQRPQHGVPVANGAPTPTPGRAAPPAAQAPAGQRAPLKVFGKNLAER
jgi:hypothetical protein